MSKRIFSCIILFILMFCNSCSPQSSKTVSTQKHYQIIYKWELQFNNHVGNDWTYRVTYAGNEISSGSYIAGTEGSYININAKMIEDDGNADIGSGTLRIPLKSSSSKSITITVREGHGRYAGNTAKWKFTCTIRKP